MRVVATLAPVSRSEPPDPPDVPDAHVPGSAGGPVKVHEIVAGGVPILAVWRMRP